jgi:hypothetical protein
MAAEFQELLALLIVAVVAGLYWVRRRRRKAGSCGDCAGPADTGGSRDEKVVRFYRRGPGG